MYAEHFGFSELPFSVTPDPGIFFDNSVYRETFAALLYGVHAKKGFVVVTGEVGTGKTTLIRKLLHSLGPTVHSVFIFDTQVNFKDLLRLILDDLNLTGETYDKLTMLQIFNQYLIDRLREGHIVALLIDEAQNLSDEALEGLRLLSNLETDTEKLLQIVLMGQPELEIRLEDPKLRQLKQRISFHCHLAPLKEEEVSAYVEFRLNAAGFRGKSLFTRASLEMIAFYSRGIPRLVNIICDNALLIAYASSKRKVSAQIIEEVARDLQLQPSRQRDARHRVHHRIPQDPGRPRTEDERLPELEKFFFDAERERGLEIPRQRRLTAGIAMLLAAVFLGGIAVSYSQQNKINLSELTASWGDLPDIGKNYFSDWTVRIQDFFERTEKLIPPLALKKDDLSIRNKDYLGAQSADFYRQGEKYVARMIEYTQNLSRRSRDYLTGLAARLRAAFGSESTNWTQISPISNTSESKPSSGTLADFNSVNPSKQTQTLSGDPATVTEKAPEKKSDARKEDNVKSPESQEPASLKPEPAPQERPNKDSPRYLGTFEVVENSFLRDRPRDDAEIITTLQPGTRVRVEAKTGNYLRVRSLDDRSVRGYVHEQDAFFERSK